MEFPRAASESRVVGRASLPPFVRTRHNRKEKREGWGQGNTFPGIDSRSFLVSAPRYRPLFFLLLFGGPLVRPFFLNAALTVHNAFCLSFSFSAFNLHSAPSSESRSSSFPSAFYLFPELEGIFIDAPYLESSSSHVAFQAAEKTICVSFVSGWARYFLFFPLFPGLNEMTHGL